MSRNTFLFGLCIGGVVGWASPSVSAEPPAKPKLRDTQLTAIANVEAQAKQLAQMNQDIWHFAEVGLQEHRSSALLQKALKEAGFQVKAGVSAMPTAFVASYGSGQPIIGILAEYDALPGMSQKVEPFRTPLKEGRAGHACGHSGLPATGPNDSISLYGRAGSGSRLV